MMEGRFQWHTPNRIGTIDLFPKKIVFIIVNFNRRIKCGGVLFVCGDEFLSFSRKKKEKKIHQTFNITKLIIYIYNIIFS
jgi:hypothetical protein